MPTTVEHFTASIEQFPQKGGWHYVPVPPSLAELYRVLAVRGLIPIKAWVGNTAWNTSMLPMGDGSSFIALPLRVRKAEKLSLGDTVEVSFQARERYLVTRTL